MPVQVFISYARDDNEPPPGPDPLPGFVKALHEYLAYQLKQLAHPRPELWRDVGKIERTDQFEEILEQQVNRSDFLIVVLSPNWLASEWCRRELELFGKRWAHEGMLKVRQRILLVNKARVDRSLRPELLQGQGGHNFFAIDQELHEGAQERPYFLLGKVKDDRFVHQVSELANKLQRLVAEKATAPQQPVDMSQRVIEPSSVPDGRTVFLARPADDMRQPFGRIFNELKGRGFAVIPEDDIPKDNSAVTFIDRALQVAELSIHLLGEKRGYAPAEEDPIVKLQLARAAFRARGSDPGGEKDGHQPFYRILFAPKNFEDPDSPQSTDTAERDPLAVRAKFGDELATDKIYNRTCSEFVDFLIRHLDQTAPRVPPAAVPVGSDAQVYLCHEPNDISYADELAQALLGRSITPVLPVLNGPRAKVEAVNRRQMQTCDAVALCWGTASEVWAMSTAIKLNQWRALGRKERFPTALLAAPPGDKTKERRLKIKPREVDVVLDLTNCPKPSPEDLDPWLGPASA